MFRLTYQIQHLKLSIEILQKDKNTAILIIDRPIPQEGILSDAVFKQEIFFEELEHDLNRLLPSRLGGNIHEELTRKLVEVIGDHCGQFGRILPNDLMTYIAEQFLIIEAMHIADDLPLPSKKQKQQSFADTYNFILSLLPPNLRIGHNYMQF